MGVATLPVQTFLEGSRLKNWVFSLRIYFQLVSEKNCKCSLFFTLTRGQVGPVLGAPDLGDGIGILFDSSAQDPQVSGGLLSVVPPTPSPSALCPGLRLLVTSQHRTALPSMCWPETGTSSTSRLGKGPPGLTPTSFLGCEELGGPHTESPPSRAVPPCCPLI